jgi:hypothetical protein
MRMLCAWLRPSASCCLGISAWLPKPKPEHTGQRKPVGVVRHGLPSSESAIEYGAAQATRLAISGAGRTWMRLPALGAKQIPSAAAR